jgi:hypothetical protein
VRNQRWLTDTDTGTGTGTSTNLSRTSEFMSAGNNYTFMTRDDG